MEIMQNDGDVDIINYPYVVSIKKNGRHICSGAILDKYHIVTSDRCVPSFKHVWNTLNNIIVVSGTSSLKPGGVRIFTKEMFSQNHHVNPLENNVTSGLGVFKVCVCVYICVYICVCVFIFIFIFIVFIL